MQKKHLSISDIKISKKAKTYVMDVLNKNRLSYGNYTKRFEKILADSHSRKFAMVVNSGTSGLQVALHALKEMNGWKDGDEVLVPSITFIATSNIVLQNNLKPVFVDVEEDLYCIDPAKIEEKITPKTRAIIPVHLFGQSANMIEIMKIAKKNKLKVLEDACETMFVNYENRPVGSMGDVSVFSTYIAHIVVTGVGGVVMTDNLELATMIKSLMFHGRDNIYLSMDDDDTKNKSKLRDLIERRFQFIHVGYSYRITEMESALGLAEIENKDSLIKNRITVGEKMTKSLSRFSDFFQLPTVRTNSEHIYMLYPIVIKDDRIDRDEFLLYLEENEIETRLFFPLLTQPIYKKLFGDIEKKYPVAKKLVARGFIIGCHPFMKDSDIKYLTSIFETFLKKKKLIK